MTDPYNLSDDEQRQYDEIVSRGNDTLQEILEARQVKKNAQPVKTLRDEMAIAALTGVLSGVTMEPIYELAADCAYKMADAMMKAREVKS